MDAPAMIMEWITSKIAGPIAIAAAIALGIMLVVTRVELAGSRHHVESLQASIDNPQTGWRANLSRCQGNEVNLRAQVADQTAKVKSTAAEMQTKIDAAVAMATKARQGQALATAKLTLLSSAPVTGDSCKDAAAMDAALLEGLR